MLNLPRIDARVATVSFLRSCVKVVFLRAKASKLIEL